VIGRPELVDAYPLPADRAAVRSLVDEVVGGWFATHSASDAERLLAAAKVPVGAVLDAVSAVGAARAVERGFMQQLSVAGPDSVPTRFLGARMPVTFDGSYLAPAPAEALGASTDEVVGDGTPRWLGARRE
jgi:crotonobetainyl-CoA:carnitine CoA-transferase CaiB-like acyl-CoA transferase